MATSVAAAISQAEEEVTNLCVELADTSRTGAALQERAVDVAATGPSPAELTALAEDLASYTADRAAASRLAVEKAEAAAAEGAEAMNAAAAIAEELDAVEATAATAEGAEASEAAEIWASAAGMLASLPERASSACAQAQTSGVAAAIEAATSTAVRASAVTSRVNAGHKAAVSAADAARASNLSSERIAEIREVFTYFDKDQSGVLEPHEASALLTSIGVDPESTAAVELLASDVSFDSLLAFTSAQEVENAGLEDAEAALDGLASEGVITESALADLDLPAEELEWLVSHLQPVSGGYAVAGFAGRFD
eukprot:gnl/Ergobibamus_cyprinoides/574.p1 GENE.gnl/Ergobibamus_cyprinoides/574~~gnl/Ergobibamus_cyprinoides/574.p1  ORF type:complete len:357 (-),score=111.43 gnl/Ergobibamus_cyprinoides/574:24-956(-)